MAPSHSADVLDDMRRLLSAFRGDADPIQEKTRNYSIRIGRPNGFLDYAEKHQKTVTSIGLHPPTSIARQKARLHFETAVIGPVEVAAGI